MKSRKCADCKQVKLYNEFHKNLRNKIGIQYTCKKCLANRRKTEKYLLAESIRKEKHKLNGNIQKWSDDYKKKIKTIYQIEKNNIIEDLLSQGFKKILFHKLIYINNNGDMYKIPPIDSFHKNNLKLEKVKLKPFLRVNGYEAISCYGIEYRVHQLVAIHFMNHIPSKHELVIDHIDGNKLNNNVSNLQLISNYQNLVKGAYYKTNELKLLKYLDGVDMIDFCCK